MPLPDTPPDLPSSAQSLDPRAVVQALPSIASAAKWFWWIAGLSLVNTVLIHSGSDTSFAVGLGMTLLADVVLRDVMAVAAFVVDGLVIGFFVAMGYFALRGHRWAFVVGGVVYLLDAAIFLLVGDYLSLGFHALALFYIFGGFKQLNEALRAPAAV